MFAHAKKTLMVAATALTLGVGVFAAAPAEAGASTGTWRNGMVAGPYGVGCYDRSCAARNYGYGRERRSYRSSYRYRPVQAYPAYRSRRARDCYIDRQRSVNRWGDVVIRRVRVCE
jgi:hypothetical protein